MERAGIGTDATMHQHIKTVQDRGYARKANRGGGGGGRQGGVSRFEPTELGLALIHAFRGASLQQLYEADFRSRMEEDYKRVSAGTDSRESVVSYSTAYEVVEVPRFDAIVPIALTPEPSR